MLPFFKTMINKLDFIRGLISIAIVIAALIFQLCGNKSMAFILLWVYVVLDFLYPLFASER